MIVVCYSLYKTLLSEFLHCKLCIFFTGFLDGALLRFLPLFLHDLAIGLQTLTCNSSLFIVSSIIPWLTVVSNLLALFVLLPTDNCSLLKSILIQVLLLHVFMGILTWVNVFLQVSWKENSALPCSRLNRTLTVCKRFHISFSFICAQTSLTVLTFAFSHIQITFYYSDSTPVNWEFVDVS